MSLIVVLNNRAEFEEITNDFNIPEPYRHASDIDSIDWFLENGQRSNSLRNGFVRATQIAQSIREYYNGCTKDTRSGIDIQ